MFMLCREVAENSWNVHGDTLTTFADNLEIIDLNEPDLDEDLLVVRGEVLGAAVLGPADAAHTGSRGGGQLREVEVAESLNNVLSMFWQEMFTEVFVALRWLEAEIASQEIRVGHWEDAETVEEDLAVVIEVVRQLLSLSRLLRTTPPVQWNERTTNFTQDKLQIGRNVGEVVMKYLRMIFNDV